MQNDFEIAKEEVKKPFEHTERLKELLSEQAQLNAELDLNHHEEVIVDDETGEVVEAVEEDKSVETTKKKMIPSMNPLGQRAAQERRSRRKSRMPLKTRCKRKCP